MEQKEIISNNGLIPNNWMFLEDLGSYIKIINKSSQKTKIVDKYRKRNVSTPTQRNIPSTVTNKIITLLL